MKNTTRNLLFGNIRFIIIGTLVAVVALVIGLIIHWQPAKTVKRQQATLMDAVESRNGARFRRMVSNSYSDRWGFTASDLTEAMLDARSQFLTMVVTSDEESIVVKGKTATIRVRLTLGGTPIGGGGQIIQEINRLKDPFIFTWKKQSFLPSSWRLISIENKAIPDNVWNYKPGSIRSAMERPE